MKLRSLALALGLLVSAVIAAHAGARPPAALRDRLLALPPAEARTLAASELMPLDELSAPAAFDHLMGLAGIPAIPVRSAAPHELYEKVSTAPASVRSLVLAAASGQASAELHVTRALQDLTASDRTFLAGEGVRALRAVHGAGEPGPERDLMDRYLQVAAKVDMAEIAAAQRALLNTAVQLSELASAVTAAGSIPSSCIEGDVVYEDPTCSLVVAGEGANRYTRDIEVTIDLGGTDRYENNAGGASGGAALAIDLGPGADHYEAQRDALQGSSFLGAGLLVDHGGDDIYNVIYAQGTDRISAQGSSEVGSGMLWDRGNGSDTYTSRNLAQGTAIMGTAALVDEGGSDRYVIPHTLDSEGGQGAGCYGGFGALIDQGSGTDVYDSTVDDMQAFACAGSLGIISDGGGNDSYIIRSGEGLIGILTEVPVIESGWGQGYGELGGAAFLIDRGGSDTYEVQVSSPPQGYEGYQSQGAAIYGAVGMLIDLSGNDSYSARDLIQGASVGGLAVLADGGGNDKYLGEWDCQGSGAGAAFIDAGRGTDTYRCYSSAYPRRGDGWTWVSTGSNPGGFGSDT